MSHILTAWFFLVLGMESQFWLVEIASGRRVHPVEVLWGLLQDLVLVPLLLITTPIFYVIGLLSEKYG